MPLKHSKKQRVFHVLSYLTIIPNNKHTFYCQIIIGQSIMYCKLQTLSTCNPIRDLMSMDILSVFLYF